VAARPLNGGAPLPVNVSMVQLAAEKSGIVRRLRFVNAMAHARGGTKVRQALQAAVVHHVLTVETK
jgi:hypothetical protein